MLIETYSYSSVTASLVRFDPGESHFIAPANPETPCIGVLFISGSWRLHESGIESDADDLGWHAPNPDGTWPRSFWNDYTAEDYCEAGPNGVEWLCLEENGTGPRTAVHLTVSGSAIVPAGSGVIVATDSFVIGSPNAAPVQIPGREISIDNKTFRIYRNPIEIIGNGTGLPMNYFSAADQDREIVGNGQILLIA